MTTLSTASAVPFRENRTLHRLCLAFGLWLIYTAINAEVVFDFWLENVLTLTFAAILAGTYRRLALSELSYILIFGFLALHEWGAEYKYSDVPLGEWMKGAWGLERNHYDRVMHLVYGLMLGYPMQEWFVRSAGVRGGFRYFLPIQFTLACSAVYEMMEAFMAAILSPQRGEEFVGMQGDIWDAQQDMFLATLGAMIAMGATAVVRLWQPAEAPLHAPDSLQRQTLRTSMPEWTLKYADARGEVHQQVAEADSERELRDRLTDQGFLVYSIKPRSEAMAGGFGPKRNKVNLEKFLIFNQQFVTLIRAGLPILKSLDLLADRLTDPKLSKYIVGVREEVKNGALLSDAFARQNVFPAIYVTSVLAGERSGSLPDVLERFITYQKVALAVRKKLIVSLIYPALLIFLVIGLVVFLVTYVVPNFAELYKNLDADLPAMTLFLIALGTTARSYVVGGFIGLIVAIIGFRYWARTPSGGETVDRFLLKLPVVGEVWMKYQVAQFSRMLGTLLVGGIPLMQALNTAAESLGTPVLKNVLHQAVKLVREGQSLSGSLRTTNIFPSLSLDMIEVGESTGALPAMLTSVAEFYEDDVSTRVTALLSLIEPIIMLIMAVFVGFVLISLYLPIFSLADSIRN